MLALYAKLAIKVTDLSMAVVEWFRIQDPVLLSIFQ